MCREVERCTIWFHRRLYRGRKERILCSVLLNEKRVNRRSYHDLVSSSSDEDELFIDALAHNKKALR
ncbi:hypothetical protein E2C01_058006 [Portunus trituberculatus]|uniref:Uncharacterized protein n=1 Tax=Portunus trituberculatus TaxID=210409 RepID=A0A5B7H451_PORTR|nr:hypothetical protein [Portunus trituberculatus]